MSDYEWDASQYGVQSGTRAFQKTLDNLKPAREVGTLKERKLLELTGLLAAASQLEERITNVTLQVEALNRLPEEDPYEDGTTLQFKRNFPNGNKMYDYVARRANGKWYTTGTRGVNGGTWEEFVNWLGLGLVGELEVMQVGKAPARKRASRKSTLSRIADANLD